MRSLARKGFGNRSFYPYAVMDRGQIVLSGSQAEIAEQNVRRYLTV